MFLWVATVRIYIIANFVDADSPSTIKVCALPWWPTARALTGRGEGSAENMTEFYFFAFRRIRSHSITAFDLATWTSFLG